ncbi:MAG: hypothetical protein LQ337_004506 [Flavoplaca oasis]|nr:MAG: hypothetical protein LQ337_004506 [Flavoplaca oasis]
MGASEDKQWAAKYLLDPLIAPEPSEETGPGTHYNSTFSSNPNRQSTSSNSTTQPKAPSTSVREIKHDNRNGFPSSPSSAASRTERFVNEQNPSRNIHNRRSSDQAHTQTPHITGSQASTQVATSTGGQNSSSVAPSTRPRRTSSLSARYQGDRSHRPLEMIARDQKLAHRSHHLRKQNHHGADSIDQLDLAGGPYHHEGPFDAASLARNRSYKNSPIEAVAGTNAEALRATPDEKVIDAVRKHRPLDGVAMVPPGQADREGRIYKYDEGTDLMIEDGGNYKRWPGVKYLPEDLKGKGEPSYSIEKALKEHKQGARDHRRVMSEGQPAYEMVPTVNRRTTGRPGLEARSSSYGNANTNPERQQRYSDWERERPRSSGGGGLRKRIGSLRRKD